MIFFFIFRFENKNNYYGHQQAKNVAKSCCLHGWKLLLLYVWLFYFIVLKICAQAHIIQKLGFEP